MDRVETDIDDSWAEIVVPSSPTQAAAVTAMDTLRQAIARRSETDEHDVEKADTVFAGLAIDLSDVGICLLNECETAVVQK